jgi:prepilin-type N-terminal cleavage/methylation domain-containing protein
MKHARPHRFAGSRGFTLIESIIVLVLLAIAAAGIISMQGNIFFGQSDNKKIQVGVQLMQECAEKILATRRNGSSGYSDSSLTVRSADTSNCSGLTISGYAAPTVTITAGNSTTAGLAACPNATGSNCKLVSITQGGLTPVTLMLVNY